MDTISYTHVMQHYHPEESEILMHDTGELNPENCKLTIIVHLLYLLK